MSLLAARRRLDMPALVIQLVAALALVLGCGADCDDVRLLETGTFRSVLVYQFTGVQPKNAFPQKRGKSLRMTIYRDLQQVTFEYVRDSKSVVETWKCQGREVIAAGGSSGDAGGSSGDAKAVDGQGGGG